jgi:hypothetical protein
MNYQRSELFQFVSYNETTKVPKPFSAKIQKKYRNNFFRSKNIFKALWSDNVFATSFSKLFSAFHFWTFIFVHFQKPIRLFKKIVALIYIIQFLT